MNLNELDPSIRRGITTIVDDWERSQDDSYDINDEEHDIIAGILQLIEDTMVDKDSIECFFANLCDRFYESRGYSLKKALELEGKFFDLMCSEKIDGTYLRKLLKEFDCVSSCIAHLDSYPLPLVQSLYAISILENHEDITPELYKDILYITSIYYGWPDFHFRKELLEQEKYDYSKSGFLSPEERAISPNERLLRKLAQEILEGKESDNRIPEVYGCCVKVRFPNGAVYKYNCRFGEVDEDSIVLVTGKMKGIKGTVVERTEQWDFADYMEEVSSIVK